MRLDFDFDSDRVYLPMNVNSNMLGYTLSLSLLCDVLCRDSELSVFLSRMGKKSLGNFLDLRILAPAVLNLFSSSGLYIWKRICYIDYSSYKSLEYLLPIKLIRNYKELDLELEIYYFVETCYFSSKTDAMRIIELKIMKK